MSAHIIQLGKPEEVMSEMHWSLLFKKVKSFQWAAIYFDFHLIFSFNQPAAVLGRACEVQFTGLNVNTLCFGISVS